MGLKLDLLVAPPGTRVNLKLKPVANVITFAVFVKKFTKGGSVNEATWPPDLLTSPDGARLDLQEVRGYHLTLHASIPSGKDGKMDATLSLNGSSAGTFPNPFTLPKSEGPVVERTWSIVVR